MQNTLVRVFHKDIFGHLVCVALIVLGAAWVYTGLEVKEEEPEGPQTSAAALEQHILPAAARTTGAVQNQDEAIQGFLNAAQTLAAVYHFTNNGSYAGLCEASQDQYTLEGESGGILKYIKFVGATEVFCSTGNTSYLIEAQMPESELFYCIDSTGAAKKLSSSSAGQAKCSAQ